MLFSLLKHHFDLNITDTALKVSQSLYCFTTSISHGIENYFPRLWGTGISEAIFKKWVLGLVFFSPTFHFSEGNEEEAVFFYTDLPPPHSPCSNKNGYMY